MGERVQRRSGRGRGVEELLKCVITSHDEREREKKKRKREREKKNKVMCSKEIISSFLIHKSLYIFPNFLLFTFFSFPFPSYSR